MPLSSIAVLALVVLLGDPGDPTLQAMSVALREALGAEVDVRTQTADQIPPAQPWATIEVQWDDDHRTATLLVRAEGQPERRTEVRFTSSDAPAERGRALGYIAAAWMQREAERQAQELPPSQAASEPEPVATQALREQTPAGAVTWRASLAAYGVFTLGLADDNASTSYGAGIVTTWWPSKRIQLRARFEARSGRIGRAQARTSSLAIEAGAGIRVWRPAPSVGLWLLLDLGVGRDAMSHFSPDDLREVERAHWLPVSTALLAFNYRMAPTFAWTLDLGSDIAWGRTQVVVRGVERAELSPLRPRATLGFLAGF